MCISRGCARYWRTTRNIRSASSRCADRAMSSRGCRMAEPGGPRARLGRRLYLRIYLALLASLIVTSVLFGIARMGFDPAPHGVRASIHTHVLMLVMLMAIALVVAAASYPIVRRLPGRLERLQASVEAWGSGDLSARVAVEGEDEVAQLARSFHAAVARGMRGDPALLRRMVRNLLENAQRHGGASPIAVALAQEGGAIRLEVCDSGPGVAADEREASFTRFYRARGASEAEGGHGLGLSLVRQIARRHGGDVAYVARPGGGGCFRVTLPQPTAHASTQVVFA